jgi:hypothetical protein
MKLLTLKNSILIFFAIIALIVAFLYFVKKEKGWDPVSIPLENNVSELNLPFTMTNDDVYYFNGGKQKLILCRDGSMRVINSSGFKKWSTPKEKITNTGSTKVVFDKEGITIKRNLLTVYSHNFPANSNAIKLVFTSNGNLNVVDDKNIILWSSNKK